MSIGFPIFPAYRCVYKGRAEAIISSFYSVPAIWFLFRFRLVLLGGLVLFWVGFDVRGGHLPLIQVAMSGTGSSCSRVSASSRIARGRWGRRSAFPGGMARREVREDRRLCRPERAMPATILVGGEPGVADGRAREISMPPHSPTIFVAGHFSGLEGERGRGDDEHREASRPPPAAMPERPSVDEGSSRSGGALSSTLRHGKGKVLLTEGPRDPQLGLGGDDEGEAGDTEASEGTGSEAGPSGEQGPGYLEAGGDHPGEDVREEPAVSAAPSVRHTEVGPTRLAEGWPLPTEVEVEEGLPGPMGRRHRVLMEGPIGLEGTVVSAHSRRFRRREIGAVRKYVLKRSRELSKLASTYHIPDGYEVKAAEGMSVLDLGARQADGWCAFYVHHLKFGVAFPLCPELVVTFNHYGVAPSQFTPNAMRIIMAIISICRIGRIRFTPTIIDIYYKFKGDAANKVGGESADGEGTQAYRPWYNLEARRVALDGGRLLLNIPSSVHG